MEVLGGTVSSSSISRAKRSLLYSQADTSIVSKKSKGASGTPNNSNRNSNNMDIDQHPFVRMARGGSGATGFASPPTNPIHSPGKRRAVYLELYRLLHAMQVHEAPVDQSWQALLMRVERAESLWQQLVELVETSIMNDEDDYDGNADDREATQKQMDALEDQVQRVTSRARECVLERRQQDTSVDHMERIFLAPLVAAAAQRQKEAENENDDDDDLADLADEKSAAAGEDSAHPFRTPAVSKNASTTGLPAAAQPNIQDLQKAQREQIEEAISQMASQMKAETARIHATLQNQSVGLDKMEDLTSENVVKVTEVATDVQQHVSNNWTRAIGTWTLLFTVLGTFLFCLVTISMIPKRPGACLFFCSKTDEQFCRILPGGRKECFNVAEMMEQHRRDVEATTTESADLDQDVDAKESPEQTCEVGMNGECLNMEEEKEDPVFHREAIDVPEMPEKDIFEETFEALNDTQEMMPEKAMFEEAFEAVKDTQTAEAKEPVKPKRNVGVTGGAGLLGGVFSQENVVAEHGTVPLYMGKPFAPRDVREAAAKGDTGRLAGYLKNKPTWVDKQDKNMWGPLHLAARTGSLGAVELLLGADCNPNLETGDGRTALDLVIEYHGYDHPIVKMLYKEVS